MKLALAALLSLHLSPLDESSYRQVIEAHRGQVVLVDFWATWCEPCRQELPVLAALEHQFRDRGFTMITVSADEPEQENDAGELLEKIGLAPPVYIKHAVRDEDFINSIDPQWSGALPAVFLYDRAGKLQRSLIGEVSASELEDAVAHAMLSHRD